MKETHIFYAPQIAEGSNELPADEAGHAVRVLRMREGDALTLTDGIGHFYDAHITVASANTALLPLTTNGTTTNYGKAALTWLLHRLKYGPHGVAC